MLAESKRILCASGAEILENLHFFPEIFARISQDLDAKFAQNFANELQNFRNFGMPLAEKLRALG